MLRRHVVPRLAARYARQASSSQRIIWTHTDEAPALASYALLPLVSRFAASAGIKVENADISVAGRILSLFPDKLTDAQRVPDTLAELGELAKTPEANIIKLPNGVARSPPAVFSRQPSPAHRRRSHRPRHPSRAQSRRRSRS